MLIVSTRAGWSAARTQAWVERTDRGPVDHDAAGTHAGDEHRGGADVRAPRGRSDRLLELRVEGGTCGQDRASPKKYSPKITFNRRTLHSESQKMPISSPKLAGPIKLGPALY